MARTSPLAALREPLRDARQAASGTSTIERLPRAEEQLPGMLEELRRLAQGLHPRILSEHGLESALVYLSQGLPSPVDLKIAADRMPGPVETAAYFVCAAALANVAKHASASAVAVTVTADDATVTVVVEDDGVAGADPGRGTGLRGISDRIGALGGAFSVESRRGRGTR